MLHYRVITNKLSSKSFSEKLCNSLLKKTLTSWTASQIFPFFQLYFSLLPLFTLNCNLKIPGLLMARAASFFVTSYCSFSQGFLCANVLLGNNINKNVKLICLSPVQQPKNNPVHVRRSIWCKFSKIEHSRISKFRGCRKVSGHNNDGEFFPCFLAEILWGFCVHFADLM